MLKFTRDKSLLILTTTYASTIGLSYDRGLGHDFENDSPSSHVKMIVDSKIRGESNNRTVR